jgi:hypothetical protein
MTRRRKKDIGTWSKPLTRARITAIFDQAMAAGDEEKAQLAAGLIQAEEMFDNVRGSLTALATDFLQTFDALPKGALIQNMFKKVSTLARGVIDGGEKPRMLAMHYEEGQPFQMEVTHWATRLMAENMANDLEKRHEPGSYNNYITATMNHPKAGEIQIRVQRVSGVTPEARLKKLRKAAASLVAGVGTQHPEWFLADRVRELEEVLKEIPE